jgi:hypothetical protein
MDDLVRRVTLVRRSGDESKQRSVVVYREPRKHRAKVSVVTRPLERGAKHLERAVVIFGQETLRRHEESNRRGRDGWLLEGPGNVVEAGRKALNEARKAVPFVTLPKL